MDTAGIIGLLQESLFLIFVFCLFLAFSMMRGVQAIINLILSLYMALIISLQFPYLDNFIGGTDPTSDAVVLIIIFVIFTVLSMLLFSKLMPLEYAETAFESFWKKVLYALLATALVMAYSYHALPVTDIITPGSPIQSLFASEANFFWWLILPIVGLFLL